MYTLTKTILVLGTVAILTILGFSYTYQSFTPSSLFSPRSLLVNDKSKLKSQELQQRYTELQEREKELNNERIKLRRFERDLQEREETLLNKERKLNDQESERFETEEDRLLSLKQTLTQLGGKLRTHSDQVLDRLGDIETKLGGKKTIRENKKGITATGKRSKFCIISAYHGDLYDPMGVLSDLTKEKYAYLHGYDFYSDPTMFNNSMSWGQKSAIRLILYRKYLPHYEWVYWSDSDVLIVNPEKKLEELVDNTHDAVISKDWGGAQTNPGSMLMKNSPGGWELLKTWEEFIAKPETYHDDLLAFEKMIHEREDMNQKVRWVRQKLLNAYPGIGMKDKSYDDLLKPENRHDLHQEGDFVVHVVNCLRDGGAKDPVCCAGLASQFFRDFELAWRKAARVPLFVED